MSTLMIYGATGYTGRMAAVEAAAAGLNPVLAGRTEQTLAVLAAELGLEYRVFGLDDSAEIDGALRGVSVVLNCAGPYARTAEPLMTAAIRLGADYLDVAAELDGYHLAQALESEAVAAGVMLLPGSGGSVIDTYVHVSGDAFPGGDLAALPDGPTPQERDANRYQASVTVTGRSGQEVSAILDTVNGYTFTPLAAIAAARRVLTGERTPGFQTPTDVFGYEFAGTIADTRIIDL